MPMVVETKVWFPLKDLLDYLLFISTDIGHHQGDLCTYQHRFTIISTSHTSILRSDRRTWLRRVHLAPHTDSCQYQNRNDPIPNTVLVYVYNYVYIFYNCHFLPFRIWPLYDIIMSWRIVQDTFKMIWTLHCVSFAFLSRINSFVVVVLHLSSRWHWT